MTALLDLPLIDATLETGTNEDWREALQYQYVGGAPINLTGIAFDMHVRTRADVAEAVIEANLDNGKLLSGGSAGTLGIYVPVEDMTRLAPQEYTFDIRASDGVSFRRVAQGQLIVVRGITR